MKWGRRKKEEEERGTRKKEIFKKTVFGCTAWHAGS